MEANQQKSLGIVHDLGASYNLIIYCPSKIETMVAKKKPSWTASVLKVQLASAKFKPKANGMTIYFQIRIVPTWREGYTCKWWRSSAPAVCAFYLVVVVGGLGEAIEDAWVNNYSAYCQQYTL